MRLFLVYTYDYMTICAYTHILFTNNGYYTIKFKKKSIQKFYLINFFILTHMFIF